MQKLTLNNKNKWNYFARKNAIYYIDTEAKDLEQFWQKGEENFDRYILPTLNNYKISNTVGIDFGCGIGRHTFPMSKYFKKVIGVDVSEEMLKQAQVMAQNKAVSNISFLENNELFSCSDPIDFIYCANVFQHIEKMEQVSFIIKNFSKILNGFAYLHFDTRPKNLTYHIKNLLPDFLLPKSQRRGIRRIRRATKDLEKIFLENGFIILEQQQPDTEYHYFLLTIAK